MNYCQCVLTRGPESQVTWIPDKFAKLGKTLKLKEEHGWEDGWTVSTIWATENEEVVKKMEYSARQYHELLEGHR